jgi:SHS family lactate transporter-like MFS transporter
MPLQITAALSVKKIMEQNHLQGTLKLWPGVAEELLGTKAYYVRAGLFKDVDICIFAHVGSNMQVGWGDSSGNGMVSVEYGFKGESAHAAGAPWRGRSALDAVELMDIGWNFRREHLRISQRSHYVIPNGGDQPNVVPPNASVWYYFRETSYEEIKKLWDIGNTMAKAAAMMTDTELASMRVLGSAWPGHFNKTIAEVMHANIEKVGLPQWSDADVALAITLTLAFRPVGAFIFGLMADRYGRRLPLMIDLVFFSVVEVLTGLVHSYSAFLVLRALFGIGMGGEWGVGASLAMEKAPSRLRGVLSGLLQEGYAAGYLLAAVCFFVVFPRWGWRPMFFIGGLPALLAVFVRVRVKESEVWEKTRHRDWANLGRAIVANWKLFLYLTLLMAMMNFVSHGTQDMYPTFLQRDWGFTPQRRAALTAFSMVGAIVGGVIVGLLSDRIGRRRAIVGALVLAILLIPLWAYAPSLALLVAGAFLMQFAVQGAWGVIPAHITELSPDSVRGFLPGFAYQCGVLIASSVPWIEARFAEHTSYANAMALTALTVFALGALAAALGRERRGVVFGG